MGVRATAAVACDEHGGAGRHPVHAQGADNGVAGVVRDGPLHLGRDRAEHIRGQGDRAHRLCGRARAGEVGIADVASGYPVRTDG